MNTSRILYLNLWQVQGGHVAGHRLSPAYIDACRFLHCGVIDRTQTLDTGFPYAVLDTIPNPADGSLTFEQLCDARGTELVATAAESHRQVTVLWSGGIDSTAALIAVLNAAQRTGYSHHVRVLLSLDSVHENPRFMLDRILGKVEITAAHLPIADALDSSDVNVTGEHGDQLFGSQLLESYVRRGLAQQPYEDIVPLVAIERLASVRSAIRATRYLQPVVEVAPVPIVTLFDYLWWMNFALKWQTVTLRIAAAAETRSPEVYHSLHHFYRDEPFQVMAMMAGKDRCPPAWVRYKELAKQYIFKHTADERYFRTKEKEDSLRNVMSDGLVGTEFQIQMRNDLSTIQHRVGRIANPVSPTAERVHSLANRLRIW